MKKNLKTITKKSLSTIVTSMLIISTIQANDKTHITFVDMGLATSSQYSSETFRTGLNLSNQYRIYLERNNNSNLANPMIYSLGFQYFIPIENDFKPYAGLTYVMFEDEKRLGYLLGAKKSLTKNEKSETSLYFHENYIPIKYLNHSAKYSFEMGITFDFF